MIRHLANRFGLVFALVFAWKLALLVFTAQPVPNNDSFFYDGPVVNFLLHGKYCNPSLVQALPISGGEVFCAYPPLYQAVLLGWMSVFGTSALSAMWLHVILLGIYFLIVLAIFRQLHVPGLLVNLAGLFLFGITFHDRPDTVAQVLGALAVLALVHPRGGVWLMVAALVLAFCASLQIGGVYLVWCGLVVIGNAWMGRSRFPWVAAVVGGVTLAGLIALVKFGYPHLWAGFQEHARITPSVTGWRVPVLFDVLKAARTVPAIFVVAAGIILAGVRKHVTLAALKTSPAGMITICGTLTALALIAVSLVVLTPNTIHITNYLQPVVVGGFLSAGIFLPNAQKLPRAILALFIALSLVTGVRAIGMTTWGVLCARDMSYTQAINRVRAEVDTLPPGSTVIASAAYLYDLAHQTNITWIHSDWPAPPGGPEDWEYQAVARLRPARIILTQFDFYRRYAAIIEQLKADPDLVSLQVINTARVCSPDSFPKVQRILQHVSWAPVVVELSWRSTAR